MSYVLGNIPQLVTAVVSVGAIWLVLSNALKEEDIMYVCECLKCGNIKTSDSHCRDIKCPE